MKEPFMYFALNDPFDLIDISEKCKVDSQTHIIQDEGWKMMTVTILLQFANKSEVKRNVMSLHVSLRWTRGVSVCCRGSFSILLSENNLLLLLNEAKNTHLWCYMLRNIRLHFVTWNMNTRWTKRVVKKYKRKLCGRRNFPNPPRRKKNWKNISIRLRILFG